MSDEVTQRKLEHVTIALEQDITVPQEASWSDLHLVHQALPEVDLDQIDTSVTFLGKQLRYPIFMSSLTGGHPEVIRINRNLAQAAETYGLALGVGSQRAAIMNPNLAESYRVVREHAPHALLIANIGAAQLLPQGQKQPFTRQNVQDAIDMIQANALAIHLNSLQEATQPEGDHQARGAAEAMQQMISRLDLPVVGKETGAGICREQALLLKKCGVAALDVGGAGGSSMSDLESRRAQAQGNTRSMLIGQRYRNWGIPTPIAIVEAGEARIPLIATGGVRSGLDAARALALGADLVGFGFPFLQAASEGYEKVCAVIEQIIAELHVGMQLCGAATIHELQQADVVVMGATREWLQLRGFEDELKAMARRHRTKYT